VTAFLAPPYVDIRVDGGGQVARTIQHAHRLQQMVEHLPQFLEDDFVATSGCLRE
jgi:hypothetical protein